MKIAVVGLGRIGLPTAVLCAMRGHDVTGVDRDRDVRTCIDFRDLPYDEPGLTEELHRIDVAESIDDVDADVWLLAVGTTVDGRLIASGVDEIVARLAPRAPWLIVIESTVPPQTCAALAARYRVPIAHCPERARPGQVFEDIATMPRLIGGTTELATTRALQLYRTLTEAPLHSCRADESELAKLAENAEREVRIAFANELADVAESHAVDPATVIELANTHPRAAILRPGVGVGGHCLPMATAWFARQSDGVTAAARALHERRPHEIAARISADLAPGAKICIIGRTYRPDTRYHQRGDGVDDYASPAVQLIDALTDMGFDVTSWDPSDDENRADAEADADLIFVAVSHAAVR